MQFPLELKFKTFALGRQISVTDASGSLLCYVKQKAFKLKEAVTVFADTEQTRPLYTIAADRVLDISARYHVAEAGGAELGVVQRRGMRSIWRTHYEVMRGGGTIMEIREENPWVKVLDGLFGEIPIAGIFSGYVFNPAYLVTRADTGEQLMRLKKEPAFLEGRFTLSRTAAELTDADERLALLSVLMMVLLEKYRG
ncbi:MAG TPA: hypothetical protein VFE05_16940 [Longimicrobiaceae bacterium]|jgi:hypothetical protein|nr:hypothetical protein [Longimicrobiaceae bacterium]